MGLPWSGEDVQSQSSHECQVVRLQYVESDMQENLEDEEKSAS